MDRRASQTTAARYSRRLLLPPRIGDHCRDRSIRREGAGQPRLLSQQALWNRHIRQSRRCAVTDQSMLLPSLLTFANEKQGDGKRRSITYTEPLAVLFRRNIVR